MYFIEFKITSKGVLLPSCVSYTLRNMCVTNHHVFIFRLFLQQSGPVLIRDIIIGFQTTVTRRVSLLEQELEIFSATSESTFVFFSNVLVGFLLFLF
jgi:hypothetical protein